MLNAKDWLTAALVEYRSLRTTIDVSVTTQRHILQFSIVLIAAVVVFGFQFTTGFAEQLAAFQIVLPVASYLLLFVWWGEVVRMTKMGNYLVGLEARIARRFARAEFEAPPPVGFEMKLRHEMTDSRPGATVRANRYPVLALLLGAPLVSGAVPVLRDLDRYWPPLDIRSAEAVRNLFADAELGWTWLLLYLNVLAFVLLFIAFLVWGVRLWQERLRSLPEDMVPQPAAPPNRPHEPGGAPASR